MIKESYYYYYYYYIKSNQLVYEIVNTITSLPIKRI